MDAAVAQPRRWTRSEYEQMIDAGIFRADEHVELLDGEILAMTPQKSQHAATVFIVEDLLKAAFRSGYAVRTQAPLALDAMSAPEPDIAVVPGTHRDYLSQHPTTALLIVEVADTSLRLDRQQKGAIYARAGIADYWIINLQDGIVEIYREPVQTSTGWGYRLVQSLRQGETVTPLASPEAPIPVAELLPPI
jgi:Uma2 family endonuclease